MGSQSAARRTFWAFIVSCGIYVLSVYCFTVPAIQRNLLYMNWLIPSWWQDVNDAEQFGFLDGQVQPFNVVTPDNETLHAWHVLPMHLYRANEKLLKAKPSLDAAQDLAPLPSLQILANHPNARVIVNLHGNVGHLASGKRPQTYRAFLGSSTPRHPVHLIAFDYRGFGLSTGTPTEEGLINDAQAVVEKLTSPPLSLSRSQIVIAGHSLGAAVAAGAAERLTFDRPDPKGTPFAGVVLFAGFSDLSSLLSTYQLFGFIPPLLSPLTAYPRVVDYVLGSIVDNWNTTARVARLMGSQKKHGDVDVPFNLVIVHAHNDREIHWSNGMRIWNAATERANGDEAGELTMSEQSSDGIVQHKLWERIPAGMGSFFKKETANSAKRARWNRIRYGGHNGLTTHGAATRSIMQAFDEWGA